MIRTLSAVFLTCGLAISCSSAPSSPPKNPEVLVNDGLHTGCGGYIVVNYSGEPLNNLDRMQIETARHLCSIRNTSQTCLDQYVKQTTTEYTFRCREP